MSMNNFRERRMQNFQSPFHRVKECYVVRLVAFVHFADDLSVPFSSGQGMLQSRCD